MQKNPSENSFVGFWCMFEAVCSTSSRQDEFIFSNTRNSYGCDRGSTKQNKKCPVQITDLVLLNNHVMETLSKPDKDINESFDFLALDFDFWELEFLLNFPIQCSRGSCGFSFLSPTTKSNERLQRLRARFKTEKIGRLWISKKQYLALAADFARISYSSKTITTLDI